MPGVTNRFRMLVIALHLFQRDRFAQRLDRQQIAQMDRRVRLHRLGIGLPDLIGRLVTCHLHQVHRLRTPSVGLTGFACLVEATNRQNVLTTAEASARGFPRPCAEARSGQCPKSGSACRGSIPQHGTAQTHGLEVQTPAIGGNHRNPHLRHDLEQALIHRFTVLGHRLGQRKVPAAARLIRSFSRILRPDRRSRPVAPAPISTAK